MASYAERAAPTKARFLEEVERATSTAEATFPAGTEGVILADLKVERIGRVSSQFPRATPAACTGPASPRPAPRPRGLLALTLAPAPLRPALSARRSASSS